MVIDVEPIIRIFYNKMIFKYAKVKRDLDFLEAWNGGNFAFFISSYFYMLIMRNLFQRICRNIYNK